MKNVLGIAVLASMFFAACQNEGVKQVKLENAKDSASYYMGFITATQRFTQNGMDTMINQQAVLFGLAEAMKGKEKIDDNKAYTLINEYLNSKFTAMVAVKRAEAEKFMEANKTKEGVISDTAGFQYQVMVQGTGPKPLPTDRVMVRYEGRLVNDTIFDSNLKEADPAVFGLNQVIPGWGMALQMMPVGSKYRLFIPPQLGYGEQGKGKIPPSSVLIFEVELVGIAAPEKPKK